MGIRDRKKGTGENKAYLEFALTKFLQSLQDEPSSCEGADGR
jgi:hypothetical protein